LKMDEEEMAIIKPTLHHVTIKTSRLAEMVTWYGNLVGAVQFKDANNAWMTNDSANHRIAFLSVPKLEDDPDKGKHNGMHHCAFEYSSFSDLMASYKRLAGENITPAFCLDHGLTISLYYKDPEGNYVELQSDNFGDWAQSGEFMRTSQDFASNPIGAFFHPQKVYEAHVSGIEFRTLQKAIRSGEYVPEQTPYIGLPV
jgi:catechol 2,3-dioxygenase